MRYINISGKRSLVQGVPGNPPQEPKCQYNVYTKPRLIDIYRLN